ncbi:T9SS type A sorting domain-containing protein [Flavobacterium sp.]|uniref:T9SS type A sorting domain-containing protein n=1 Tax=Flavobacterium sp. TaxID=239 RepID=UPI0039E35AF2
MTLEINTMADVPENDSCATAFAILSFPYTLSQDASAATNNDGFIDTCSGMNDGVWFTFVGNGNDVVIDCTDIVGWDPELGVYSGSCGTFTCVGQVDDNGTGGDETLEFSTVAGTVYYINFGHYSSGNDEPEGVYTITITEHEPPQPIANDACADAIAITSFPYTNAQDATLATNNGGFIVAGCSSDMNDGAWYTFTGNGNEITVEISNVDGWDPQLDVYTGSCGTFTCAGSADDGGNSAGETVTVASVAGTTYFINVGHYSGFDDEAEGPYQINVSSVLGTQSFAGAGFKSYPNPVKDVLNVSYSKTINEVTVYNLLGQQVFAKSLNAKGGQINLSSLNTGNYIVKLTSDQEVQTLKILKQ